MTIKIKEKNLTNLKVKDILFIDRLKTVTPGSAKYTTEPNDKELVLIYNV